MAHEHDRFLYEKDGALHFGCVNPFCGHGSPALPKHYCVSLDRKDVVMRLLAHDNGQVRIEVTPKDTQCKPVILTAEDNLEACREAFNRLQFSKKEKP